MLAQSIKHSWVKHLIVGLLAPVFVLLSGPVFFCKCDRQVVTMSQLKTSAECCAAHCEGEPDPGETEAGCPKDPTSPCNEEIELVFAHPDGSGGHRTGRARRLGCAVGVSIQPCRFGPVGVWALGGSLLFYW